MRFANPHYAFLFLAFIPLIALYIFREQRSQGAIRYSDTSLLKDIKKPITLYVRHGLLLLRLGGLALLIVALMRPQKGRSFSEITTEGVDIMMVLDVSGSMEALDFKPNNRLAVAKEKIKEFINLREQDRVGLVVFAGRSYTKCPLTLDYPLLEKFVDDIDFSSITTQGTAIGTAIATAANRLRESPSKTKIMILLTDGSNNSGEIAPVVAAQASAQLGIKIYTIGIGKKGMVDMPVYYQDPYSGKVTKKFQKMQSDLDEGTLEKVANITGGTFFRAQNSEELSRIYEMIDRLEKTELKTRQYTTWNEKFYGFLLWGALLILIDFILRHTRFRRIP